MKLMTVMSMMMIIVVVVPDDDECGDDDTDDVSVFNKNQWVKFKAYLTPLSRLLSIYYVTQIIFVDQILCDSVSSLENYQLEHVVGGSAELWPNFLYMCQ